MNSRRRKKLLNIISALENINEQIAGISYEEQDSLDNIPENLLESDRCVKMEENIDRLEDLSGQIDSVIEEIQRVVYE